jgi:hypothetical protein
MLVPLEWHAGCHFPLSRNICVFTRLDLYSTGRAAQGLYYSRAI